MPTTIRTREPRELLALLPFQLGFHPAESAVLVSLRGSRRRVGLMARTDLADLADPGEGPALARSLVGHLLADGARRAVLVLYTATDMQAASGAASEAGTAVRTLLAAAEHGLPEPDVECWVVGPRGYYALGCADRTCCPVGGRPLADLEATEVGAQMVLEGVRVAGSRAELGVVPPAGAAARKAAQRARARWRARGAAAGAGAEAHRWRRDGFRLWQGSLDAALAGAAIGDWPADDGAEAWTGPRAFGPAALDLPAATVGRLLAALDDVLVRDAALLSFVAGNERVAERLVAGERGADIGRALRPIVDAEGGRPPEPRRLRAARAVLERIVAHAPRTGHAPGLTLLAVLAWWEGDGARAGVLVDRALAADGQYRLAVLVDQALRAGLPPGWARAAASAFG